MSGSARSSSSERIARTVTMGLHVSLAGGTRIAATMRAAFFEGMKHMVVRDADPPALSDGEARVRVHHCGICGSDLSLYKTGILAGSDQVLGHEFSGVVEEDPTGTFEPGPRVVAWPA